MRKYIPTYEMFLESFKNKTHKVNEGRGNATLWFNGNKVKYPFYYIDLGVEDDEDSTDADFIYENFIFEVKTITDKLGYDWVYSNKNYLEYEGSKKYDFIVLAENNDGYQIVTFNNEWSIGIGVYNNENEVELSTNFIEFEADNQIQFEEILKTLRSELKEIGGIEDEYESTKDNEIVDNNLTYNFVFYSDKNWDKLKNHDYVISYGNYGTMHIDKNFDDKVAEVFFKELNKNFELIPYSGAWTSGRPIKFGEYKGE